MNLPKKNIRAISQCPEVGKVYTITQLGDSLDAIHGKTIFVTHCLKPESQYGIVVVYFLDGERKNFRVFQLLEKGNPLVDTVLMEPNEL